MGSRPWLGLTLCACGRLGFDPISGPGGGGGDGALLEQIFDSQSGCASTPGILLCDGFEPNTPVPWQPVIGNGTVAMTTDMPHTGTRSLRAEGISGRTVAFMRAPIQTVSAGEIHLRGFFYRPATATATDIYLARVGDGIANSEFFGVAGGANPGVDSGAAASFPAPAFAADRWVCVEVHVANGQVRLDLDGVQHVEVALDAFGPYSEVAFGIVADVGTPDTFLIFVDDIIARTQPIGCTL